MKLRIGVEIRDVTFGDSEPHPRIEVVQTFAGAEENLGESCDSAMRQGSETDNNAPKLENVIQSSSYCIDRNAPIGIIDRTCHLPSPTAPTDFRTYRKT